MKFADFILPEYVLYIFILPEYVLYIFGGICFDIKTLK